MKSHTGQDVESHGQRFQTGPPVAQGEHWHFPEDWIPVSDECSGGVVAYFGSERDAQAYAELLNAADEREADQ